jgi:Starch-binding associating with outer membrane
MNFNKNILTILLVMGMASGCNLDLLDNPNEIAPEQASLNDLYNRVQLDFNNVFFSANMGPGRVARMYQAGGNSYNATTTAESFNGLWGNAYNNLFPNIAGLQVLEDQGETKFDIHIGTAMIMKAYTLMTLVDILGPVPNSEALQGTDIISPRADDGAIVYADAIVILDEAITRLTGTTSAAPAFDNFYGGDVAKWITLANTIKKRAYLNMGDAGAFNAITDFIDSPDEDFQFNYGSQRNNPNSRHPLYNNMYENNDGNYMANYYMWSLRLEKLSVLPANLGNVVVDPRLRYYFYRKVDDSANQDLTTYSCFWSAGPVQSAKPAHYIAVDPRLPYCYASDDGYIGRDHLNGEGIPPDGPIRTSYGLYPMGGDFDDDSFDDTRELGTTGGLGQGINPIILSSFGHFMMAEAELTMGGTPAAAEMHMEAGIRDSFDKVEGFESLVSAKMGTELTLRDGSTGTVKELFGMSDDDKDDYVDEVKAMFNAGGADQLDIVIKEFYIAAWGNGLEAYNMYRRTGKPGNIQPGLDPAPGQFPLSFFYPSNSETRNSNIVQKANLGVPVFWQDATIASGLY